MRNQRPYLSIVVASRNDDHGGNLKGRMQAFVNSLAAQVQRYDLPTELIIVEWNPPPDRPPLSDALQWPADSGPFAVRIIQVPTEIHRQYRHAEALPLYQMIAKNVGIRRAEGEFVLATNIDILFSNPLFAFLADRRLEEGKMYRVDRYDVPADVPVEAALDERLEYCESHLIRVYAREGVFPTTPDGVRALSKRDIASQESGIFLGPGWYEVEFDSGVPFRWVGNRAEVGVTKVPTGQQALAFDVEPGPGVGGRPFDLSVTDEQGRVVAEKRVRRREEVKVPVPADSSDFQLFLNVLDGGIAEPLDPRVMNAQIHRCYWDRAASVQENDVAQRSRIAASFEKPDDPRVAICPEELHTRACGDFTLMARKHWLDLRAHAEFDMYSMNIDSVLCFVAHHSGAIEVELPHNMRVYHIDHEDGSGWTPEGSEKLFERLSARGIESLHHLEVFGWATQMRRMQRPIIFNGPDWGLSGQRLPESSRNREAVA